MSDWSRRSVLTTLLTTLAAALNAAVFSPRGASAATGEEHIVDIEKFLFKPDSLKVRVGDRITWINRDIAPHTATALDGSWDTGQLKLGQSSTIDVSEGMFGDYLCVFHPHMEAKITIID